jgi:hypothetical protein
MSSILQGTTLIVQIHNAHVEGNSLIVSGTATATREAFDTSTKHKPLSPLGPLSQEPEWFVDNQQDVPLPGKPLGSNLPSHNEDPIEDRTDQIDRVEVSFQIGSGQSGAFQRANPTGPGAAEWASWTYSAQLPSTFTRRTSIRVTAQARLSTLVDTTSAQVAGLGSLITGLQAAKS